MDRSAISALVFCAEQSRGSEGNWGTAVRGHGDTLLLCVSLITGGLMALTPAAAGEKLAPAIEAVASSPGTGLFQFIHPELIPGLKAKNLIAA